MIEIAGRQVRLPEDVHVETVNLEAYCIVGDACLDVPASVLRRGDLLVAFGKRSELPAPGRDIPEAFYFIREALR